MTRFDCSFGGAVLTGNTIRHGFSSHPVAGAQAEAEAGGKQSRMTATRIVAGTVLLGPVGTLLGGMARKDRSKCYVAVVTQTGSFVLTAPLRAYDQALRFASNVNAASRYWEEQNRLAQQMRPAAPPRPAGWYPDPTDNRAQCWWDGARWIPQSKRYPQ